MTGTPKLGYCLGCLQLIWRELVGINTRKDVRVYGDPAHPEALEIYFVVTAGAAIDAYERGAQISAGGLTLRMRADVLTPNPRCVDHAQSKR